ncbi:MAG TPA: hypothetical protein VG407_00225 [Caulobacteraceae bacterium]|jgi:hypothetical protein|nr:hypothetical protein [Caulobacteraceae bacterium]
MEVHHHPHPGHTWKEFAREIGIVVIGVLLALGAENIAEGFHWRHEVEQEREALRGEVRYNLATATFRKSQQPCIDARLQQIGEVFRRHAKGEALGLKGPVARPPFWGGSTGTWDIGVAGQALGHMQEKEKLAFSDAFQTYKQYNNLHNEEDADWRKLALLDHADLLDANDWSRLHETWGDLIGMSNRIHSIGDDMLENMTMGQRAGQIEGDEADLHKAFCTPIID